MNLRGGHSSHLDFALYSIHCESSNTTLKRLDEALMQAGILQESFICVTADKEEIKEKLKQACRREEPVQIARKFCLEEKQGKYYCLKDGKCFGNLCKGCIKHECQIKGEKKILNPPKGSNHKPYGQKIVGLKHGERGRKFCNQS